MIPRPCIACGRRVTDGGSRCVEHKDRPYGRNTSCRECGIRTKGALYCPDHTFVAEQDRKPQRERVEAQPWRRGYRDPQYHRERQAALKRSGNSCEKCGRSELKLEVDHIIPLSSAKDLEDVKRLNKRANLAVLCVFCHRRKTQRRP